MGALDVGKMFFAKFSDQYSATDAIDQLYNLAGPWFQLGPHECFEKVIMNIPTGESGAQIKQLAQAQLPGTIQEFGLADQEIVMMRLIYNIPVDTIPQLGHLAESAYNAAFDVHDAGCHNRVDISNWVSLEV
ncbi:MAG: hypothetical protein R3B84_06255 [Zavarzinella sp.]